MRIAILTNEVNYTCGVTNHLIHLCRGLTESGIKLSVITGGGNGIERLRQTGTEVYTVKYFHHSERSLIGFIRAVLFLSSYCRSNNIKIVHSHYHYGANIAQYAKLFAGIKTVQTNHGIIGDQGILKHFNADRYIAINEHIREYIINNNIAKDSEIDFIRCGIPIPEHETEKTNDTIRFVFASRLTTEKGADTFIKAVSLLNDSVKSRCEFIMAGEGKDEEYLKKYNSELNAGVNFIGRADNIYALLENSHALIYCSKSLSEGFPAIITEAGATGNIVITTRFRGSEPVLKDGVNCLMYNAEDSDHLKELIQKIAEDYHKYRQLSSNLFNYIKNNFSISEMITKHIDLYNKLIV